MFEVPEHDTAFSDQRHQQRWALSVLLFVWVVTSGVSGNVATAAPETPNIGFVQTHPGPLHAGPRARPQLSAAERAETRPPVALVSNTGPPSRFDWPIHISTGLQRALAQRNLDSRFRLGDGRWNASRYNVKVRWRRLQSQFYRRLHGDPEREIISDHPHVQ